MQESITSKYNKLLSFRYEEVVIQNLEEYFSFIKSYALVLRLQLHLHKMYFFRPTSRVHIKVETLVPSAMIDIQSSQSNSYNWFAMIMYTHVSIIVFFSIYLVFQNEFIILNINITPFWHPKSVMIYICVYMATYYKYSWLAKETCTKSITPTETNYNLHIRDTIVTPSEKRLSSFQR